MKVLVIGGTRYVGRLVVSKLIDAGCELTVVSRGNNQPPWINRVCHIEGDRRNASTRNNIVGQFDVIIDFVGYAIEDVRALTEHLGGKFRQYIFISSTAAYNGIDLPPALAVKEADLDLSIIPYSKEDEFSYAAGKRDCEKYLSSNSTFDSTVFRPPKIFGADDPSGRFLWWLQRVGDGGPVLVPNEYDGFFQFVYAHDLADAIFLACGNKSAFGKTFNVANDAVLDVATWVRVLAEAVQCMSSIVWLEREVIERAIGPYAIPLYEYQPYTFDTSELKNSLDWKPAPITEWLRESVCWYLQEYQGEGSNGYRFRNDEIVLANRLG